MIVSNLNVLIAERGLKMSDVAKKLGISRTTLYYLASNRTGGIQISTIEGLCKLLDVKPDELFTYEDLNITLDDFKIIDENNKILNCSAAVLFAHNNILKDFILSFNVSMIDDITKINVILKADVFSIKKLSNSVPIAIVGGVKSIIEKSIYNFLKSAIDVDNKLEFHYLEV